MDVVVTTPLVLALTLMVGRLSRGFSKEERPLLWASYLLHLVSGAAMIFITRDYYEGGDMLGYHQVGTMIAARWREDFWELAPSVVALIVQRGNDIPMPVAVVGSNTGAMQGVSAVLMYLFADSLFATCAAIAGASFVAKVLIYKVIRAELPDAPRRPVLAACLLVPSAVFWTSGLLKEPIAFLGLALMVRGGHSIVARGRKWSGFAYLLAGGTVVILLKGYILPPFGFGAAVWVFVRGLQARGKQVVPKVGTAVLSVVLAVAVVVGTGALFPQFAVENFAEVATREQEVGARTSGGSNYSLGSGAPSLAGQLGMAPFALLTALFRPVVFEVRNVMMGVSSLEMLVLTILFVRVLAARSLVANLAEVLRRPTVAFCAAFVVTMGVGVGLASTNIGSLSRYRAPMMPFFGVALVTLVAIRNTTRNPEIVPGGSRRPLSSHPAGALK